MGVVAATPPWWENRKKPLHTNRIGVIAHSSPVGGRFNFGKRK